VRLAVLYVLQAYAAVILVRALLSWFPIRPGSPLVGVMRVLVSLTEPVLRPIRRAIPPIGGGLDISPLILLLAIQVLARLVFA
jgi:YggT family protein